MGVPGFYRWLCQRYPLIRRRLDDPSRPVFNNLYIDLNGIIYRAISATNFTGPEITTDFLSEIYRYIDLLVQVIKPKDLIFIAVDGPAPFAKATQQRGRRYLAAQGLVPNSFDRSSISPGTDFMLQLHKHLLDFFSKQRTSDIAWATPNVIYSSAFVPGEGEHKIMDYIRENRSSPDWNPNQVHCIYSTDADLLFLGLQTHEPYVVILREIDAVFFKRETQVFEAKTSSVSWSNDAFEIVHISLVREYLALDFGVDGEDLEMTIDDFIAISFLIGNDFIPNFNDIDIRTGSYDSILNAYKNIRENSPYLIENGEFNRPVLKQVLEAIVSLFRDEYKEAMKLEGTDEEIAAIYTEKNRKYLLEKYPDRAESIDSLIEEMSHSILDSFNWVLKYYNSGCPSWRWCYQFHYAPPLEFVIPFVESHTSEFEEGFPNKPLLQLLAIIPPQSKALLPPELQELMEDDDLKEFYPLTFETDLNGRKAEWQSVILLPFIDLDLLEEVFNEVELPEEYSERNNIEFPVEFSNGIEFEEIAISKGELFDPENKSTEVPSCIPTLEGFEYTPIEKVVPVKLFERPSSKPSIVISAERQPQTVNDVLDMIGTTVLINWPYLRPAIVEGALDIEKRADSKKTVTARPETNMFPANECNESMYVHLALQLGNISVFLNVRAQNSDGTFESRVQNVPINLVVPVSFNEKVLENFKEPVVRKPDIGETIVFNGGMAENFVGSIKSIKSDKSFDVIVHQRLHPQIRTLINDDFKKWMSMEQIVKGVGGISFKGMRYALSKIIIDPGNVNIALTLFTNEHMVIDGCCKYTDRSYVFASFVLPLVKEYFLQTGNLKSLIMESINKKEQRLPTLTLEQLYGGSEEHQKECYEKLVSWLSQNAPAAKHPLISDQSSFLSTECLSTLESNITSFKFNSVDKEMEDYDVSSILWRQKPNPKSPAEMPKVGQRVISVASSGPATYGEIGTVIETDPRENHLTVLFDKELPCGTRLEGRLRTNRGLRLNLKDIVVIRGT
ncbi:XRN 5'-3' exonuclease N-terminus family protein [Tritrichomonas foetus]|uniref:XRN 5'-3' exonuclease N-terminus family protein n=1 Tax=Tritrichomonas foetus TaxID=1144522 RepID=A0A1J4JI93_9EUKA|nr:XRN 5'-3' exonuclease N-terminus family protein [Tritrichomonas foetus]|eukprot:OHS98409.1 XRN 5'-3' exonuclease N-terminus family protein [Tritrichomonas foetus]